MVAVSTKKRTELAHRRLEVAGLYLNKKSQVDIAKELGVDQSTISRDVSYLRQRWAKEAQADIAKRFGQELAELIAMEVDCAIEFTSSKEARWMTQRLRIKERIARMLGLDAPARQEITGAMVVGNVQLTGSQRERALEQLAEIHAKTSLGETDVSLPES